LRQIRKGGYHLLAEIVAANEVFRDLRKNATVTLL